MANTGPILKVDIGQGAIGCAEVDANKKAHSIFGGYELAWFFHSPLSYITSMSTEAIGLDIGGANIKAASDSGRARSERFELWKYPEKLTHELARIKGEFFPNPGTIALTMTGELCDCFPTKRDGVRHILAAARASFPQDSLSVWTVRGEFLPLDEAIQADPLLIAAANWHAQATFVSRFLSDSSAILIDTGSTTTDIIPIQDGFPCPEGRTDPTRLVSGELVYSGVRRTPLCAIMGPSVAAEWFATTHDAYVRLGILPEEPTNTGTADSRPMTHPFAHARLARMLGGDSEITSQEETTSLAQQAFDNQCELILQAMRRVVARFPRSISEIAVSGSGEFLALRAAKAFVDRTQKVSGRKIEIISLSEKIGPILSEGACAYAVARLRKERES
jgi:probable H4MPT-linked C1 transfer pathway protein